ncbi:DUF1877 family protein [Streptomyces diastatochromogenes]|uniref:DUF1877 family protein n=1 Tax=Streptomyces diastatochromogenes TaxID=42236 RepID=UPI00365A6EEA
MGNSMRMRRVPADALDRGIAFLEDGFTATRQNEVFTREIESGTLCSLAEEWQPMDVLLTGVRFPDPEPECLPVLGGVHVASFETPVDVMIWLDTDGVRAAHAYLEGIDFDERFERHRKRLEFYGDLGYLETDLRRRLSNLQRFYALADAAGEAVVKRVYA